MKFDSEPPTDREYLGRFHSRDEFLLCLPHRERELIGAAIRTLRIDYPGGSPRAVSEEVLKHERDALLDEIVELQFVIVETEGGQFDAWRREVRSHYLPDDPQS